MMPVSVANFSGESLILSIVLRPAKGIWHMAIQFIVVFSGVRREYNSGARTNLWSFSAPASVAGESICVTQPV